MSSTGADLKRFEEAQAGIFEHALAEIRAGRKRTRWMWFVFPQVVGLGSSATARRFAIHDWDEAVAFLEDPLLGAHYRMAVDAVWRQVVGEGTALARLFPYPDDLKLVSSLTLFSTVGHSFPMGAYSEERWLMWAAAVLDAARAQGYEPCEVTERFLARERPEWRAPGASGAG